jgi:hypothetical protein
LCVARVSSRIYVGKAREITVECMECRTVCEGVSCSALELTESSANTVR